MPFFCSVNSLFESPFPFIYEQSVDRSSMFPGERPFDQKKTLQVRIPRKLQMGRKRVSFSAPASMTAEAALVLPMFLFAGVILMMPFRILDTERQMQAIVMSVGEDISQAAYLTEEALDGLGGAAVSAYAEAAVRVKASELPVQGVSLAESRLLADGETIDLVVKYDLKLPFSVFGLDSVKRTNRCYLRAWVGSDGNGKSAGAGSGDDEDPIVYVGRNSTRYHVSASCHYLSNRLTAVPFSQIDSYRNQDGSRYTACARCGGQVLGTVYIMPAGEHYHSSRNCSAILAYVRAVRKSTVEYLGACSYCSGG